MIHFNQLSQYLGEWNGAVFRAEISPSTDIPFGIARECDCVNRESVTQTAWELQHLTSSLSLDDDSTTTAQQNFLPKFLWTFENPTLLIDALYVYVDDSISSYSQSTFLATIWPQNSPQFDNGNIYWIHYRENILFPFVDEPRLLRIPRSELYALGRHLNSTSPIVAFSSVNCLEMTSGRAVPVDDVVTMMRNVQATGSLNAIEVDGMRCNLSNELEAFCDTCQKMEHRSMVFLAVRHLDGIRLAEFTVEVAFCRVMFRRSTVRGKLFLD
ncbi:hypothetical protein C8R45DRAFT_944997 [Mycena sanguinolenta]|nr:hypothetical protein C8R45DRAFT_944997 [Mycena sanguinolenta]